jgi:hypothetical protein
LGSSTNLKLLKQPNKDDALLAARAPHPPRGVSQSTARTRLVPAADGTFGLMAEVRETVAPITVLEGEQQITIEVLGEWVLRAVADGRGGQLVFGPDVPPGDKRPLLRIIDANGKTLSEVTIQEYFGSEGFELDVDGLVRITVGEDPRAVGGDAESDPVASPALTAGAADILRVNALDPVDEDFDELRIGHMEAAVSVPAGGLRCPGIGVKKALDRRSVQPGEKFTTTITVTNPNDCILEDVKVTDTIKASPGVTWNGRGIANGVFTAENLGPLGPGESDEVSLSIEVDPTSLPGVFSDAAVADGTCGRTAEVGETTGGTAEAVPVSGTAELEGPSVSAVPVPEAAVPLESASPAPPSSPGGATAAQPVSPARKVAAAPAPANRRQAAPQRATRSAATPAATGPSALARSGGLLGTGLAFSLLAAGVGLRALNRRRPAD